jgi:hypothetical protein
MMLFVKEYNKKQNTKLLSNLILDYYCTIKEIKTYF